jgi:DNA-binding NarL/FixJ family response regulator
MSIRVILADDHRLVMEGIAQLLSLETDIEVVMRCADGVEALAATSRFRPDVLLADVKMPGLDGIELLRRVRDGEISTRVALLTADITDQQVAEAIRLGVDGIVLKEAAPRTLVQCVRAVAAGEQWLDQRTVHRAVESAARREAEMQALARILTRREIEIVRMVATGLRNKEIADRLGIAEGTVKIHLHSIYEKTGVSGRVELTNYARERGLLP